MSLVETEHVLVIPTEVFRRSGYFQGFRSEAAAQVRLLLDPKHAQFLPRGEMEADPSFKQLIPYCVFRWRDAAGQPHVFQYARGTGQGEGRLHRKRSVGVGGHVSVDDQRSASGDTYREGLERELAEEVKLETTYKERLLGLINDDATEVGRVHLGVVHLFEVTEPRVLPCESDLLDAGFRPLGELLASLSEFETWSQYCLREIDE
jgi:predicted NUDIX family phosphoesterase